MLRRISVRLRWIEILRGETCGSVILRCDNMEADGEKMLQVKVGLKRPSAEQCQRNTMKKCQIKMRYCSKITDKGEGNIRGEYKKERANSVM